MLAEMPDICLVACKASAMNSGLLTCADTDSLTVYRIANGVGLCVFKCDKGNDKVSNCTFGQVFVCRYDVGKERAVDFKFVSALFERDTVNLFLLNGFGNVVFVDFYDIVGTFALGTE